MIQLFVIVKTTGCYFIQSYCIELLAQLLQFCTCLMFRREVGMHMYVMCVCVLEQSIYSFMGLTKFLYKKYFNQSTQT